MFGTPKSITPPAAGKFGSETVISPPVAGQFGSLGATPWSPLDLITGTRDVAIYDFSDLSRVFQNSTGTTAGAVDQPIGRINCPGYGKEMVQATDANRPTLRNSGAFWWAEFDGVTDRLDALTAADWTRLHSSVGGAIFDAVEWEDASPQAERVQVATTVSGGTAGIRLNYLTNASTTRAVLLNGTTSQTSASASFPENTPKLLIAEFDTPQSLLKMQSYPNAPETNVTITLTPAAGAPPIPLRILSGDSTVVKRYATVVILGDQLSAGERNLLIDWFKTKVLGGLA